MTSSIALPAFSRFAGALPPALYPFEEVPGREERDHLETYGGPLRAKISARNDRSGVRVPRLRQRWLDGHLSGQ